jgi:hypothetical protein
MAESELEAGIECSMEWNGIWEMLGCKWTFHIL